MSGSNRGKIQSSKAPYQTNFVDRAAFTIGAKATNTIKVTVQLKTSQKKNLYARGAVDAYLSDDANGDSIVASAPSSGWAINTNGVLIPIVSGKYARLISETNGLVDIDITEAGTKTCYLVIVMPDGRLVVSGAITF